MSIPRRSARIASMYSAMSIPRRSARIASMYGAMYSNIPSMKAKKRAEAEAKKSMEVVLKKEYHSSTNALEFHIQDFDVHFKDSNGWAAKRYTNQPIPGHTYDKVFVKVAQQDHSGYCSDAEDMIENEGFLILYFHRLEGETPLKDMIPATLTWLHRSENHYWCGAQDRYSIHDVTSIVAPPEETCRCEECQIRGYDWN